MNWQSVIEAVKAVGIFAIGSGLLTWLIQNVAKHALDRDLEAFKHGLRKAHEIEMEEARNRFTVGATSHMANVAFDKHVQFCEEYAAEVNRTLGVLFSRGVRADVLGNARALGQIRTNWTVWLTPDIEAKLEKFENALRTIGAQGWLLEQLQANEDRHDAIRQAYSTFAAVVGWENWQGEPVTRELAAEKIVQGLRELLGIAQLSQLRIDLVGRAVTEPRLPAPRERVV